MESDVASPRDLRPQRRKPPTGHTWTCDSSILVVRRSGSSPGTPLTREWGPGLLWASVAHLKDLQGSF